jgi:recombinational DNA repair ATPase RecF
LLEALAALGAQSWMTGTDAQLFEAIGGHGAIFHVEDGQVREVMER